MCSARGDSFDHFDLGFRPASYLVRGDTASAMLQHIPGDLRREMARDAMVDALGLRAELSEPNAPPAFQDHIERLDPRWMGGEYLPDYEEGEVEIARLVVASVTRDVYGVRARWAANELRYRIVDEYATDWHLTRETSLRPLSMGELVELIDRATFSGNQWDDLTDALRDGACGDDGDPADAIDFVSVKSELYPQLERYYAAKAAAWLANRRAAHGPARVPAGEPCADKPGVVFARANLPTNYNGPRPEQICGDAATPAGPRTLPDIATSVNVGPPAATPPPNASPSRASMQGGAFDEGSFYRNRHRERIARAHELADGAPGGAAPGLRGTLVKKAEGGRWLTHDDLRRLLLRLTHDRGDEPHAHPNRR